MNPTLEEIDRLKALMEANRRRTPKDGDAELPSPAKPKPVEPAEPVGGKPRKCLPADYVPSEAELRHFLKDWDELPEYVAHEKALNLIFRQDEAFAANTDIRHVIIKCSALNDFYATNIFSIYPVAENILKIKDFDARLRAGDDSLVDEIATVEGRRNYSFATKYCSHHQPLLYPIYDLYVDRVLTELRRRNPEAFRFRKHEELKDYATFRGAIDDVRLAYGLQAYSYKDIDRYLWQLGKLYYNQYTNK